MLTNRRAAFLAGEGTLTVEEVVQWAHEMDPLRLVSMPAGLGEDDHLMVSVVPDLSNPSSEEVPS